MRLPSNLNTDPTNHISAKMLDSPPHFGKYSGSKDFPTWEDLIVGNPLYMNELLKYELITIDITVQEMINEGLVAFVRKYPLIQRQRYIKELGLEQYFDKEGLPKAKKHLYQTKVHKDDALEMLGLSRKISKGSPYFHKDLERIPFLPEGYSIDEWEVDRYAEEEYGFSPSWDHY
jgi:hypothetical protein